MPTSETTGSLAQWILGKLGGVFVDLSAGDVKAEIHGTVSAYLQAKLTTALSLLPFSATVSSLTALLPSHLYLLLIGYVSVFNVVDWLSHQIVRRLDAYIKGGQLNTDSGYSLVASAFWGVLNPFNPFYTPKLLGRLALEIPILVVLAVAKLVGVSAWQLCKLVFSTAYKQSARLLRAQFVAAERRLKARADEYVAPPSPSAAPAPAPAAPSSSTPAVATATVATAFTTTDAVADASNPALAPTNDEDARFVAELHACMQRWSPKCTRTLAAARRRLREVDSPARRRRPNTSGRKRARTLRSPR